MCAFSESKKHIQYSIKYYCKCNYNLKNLIRNFPSQVPFQNRFKCVSSFFKLNLIFKLFQFKGNLQFLNGLKHRFS